MEEKDREKVLRLRDTTGMHLMKCRAALLKADHDYDKALSLLRVETREAMRRSGGIMED